MRSRLPAIATAFLAMLAIAAMTGIIPSSFLPSANLDNAAYAQTADTPTPVPTPAQSEGSDIQNLPPIKGKLNPPQYPNMNSNLNRIVEQVQSGQLTAKAAASNAPIHDGASVAVTLYITEGYAQDVWDWLEENGASPRNIGVDYVEAYIPVSLLPAASQQEGVIGIRTIVPAQPAQGMASSEGVQVHGAIRWQAAGYRGQGIKIGIIDRGYSGYHSLAGTELPSPSNVHALCFPEIGRSSSDIRDCAYRNSKHGTGAMEVLFDFAPDATYYVTNDWSSQGDVRTAVDWMIANGVDIINASAGWTWTGPGDGTSQYSDSILKTVDAAVSDGAIWSNSAGNNYDNSWLGTFSDSDGDGNHNFQGDDECNDVDVYAGSYFRARLRWEDTWGGASRDLDLYLLDSSGNVVLDSNDFQRGEPFNDPHEALSFTPSLDATYCLSIRQVSGDRPGWIELIAWQEYEFEHFTDAGGLISPSDSRNSGLLAVAAAPWHDTNTIASYSSRGPTTDGRIKPDITGATDGSSVIYEGSYGGTSGASPHIAGLAALVKQRFPDYGPFQIAQYLKDRAEPRSNVPNNTWGYGFAKLPASDVNATVECRSDCQTLLAAKNTLIGSSSVDLNWDADIPIFDWEGVAADADLRVTRISLAEKGLRGEIPPELGNLSNLSELSLSENNLTGTIPTQLGNLSNLKGLYLDENQLTGTIPTQLGNLSNLEWLYLSRNQLTGTIPTRLGNLYNLERLSVAGNQLTGTIPAELSNLSNLTELSLWRNNLTGTIPAGLGNLSHLKWLAFSDNQLSGTIPTELGNLSELKWLYLNHNQLTGTIPTELSKLSNLERLYLGDNQFTGCIPAALSDVAENDLEELALPICNREPTPTPTSTLTPTATPTTVQTPMPTATSTPVQTPMPTVTPTPVQTTTPTATPVAPQIPEEVLNRISALETLVATLQGLIATLQSTITALDSRVTTLEEDASRPTPIPTPTATPTPTPTSGPGVPTPTPSPTPTPIADPCVESISANGTISGSWTDGSDCTSQNRADDDNQVGAYARYYTFTLSEASDVTVTLESQVDTYIYLLSDAGKDGAELCNNDDHHASDVNGEKCKRIADALAEDTDAGLTASLDSGDYTIEATTWYANKPGSFTLTVSGIP